MEGRKLLSAVLFLVLGLSGLEAKVDKRDIAEISASSEMDINIAKNAFDGDAGTRWESEWQSDPSWIAVEFKKDVLIRALRIMWENASAEVYRIEVSENGKQWESVKNIEDGKFGEERIIKLDKAVVARHLRIFCKKRTMDDYGYSIFEVELNPVVLDETNKVKLINAKATSVQTEGVPEDVDFSAEMAIDGDITTRWSSVQSDPQKITVKLENVTEIEAVKINWETASAQVYKVMIANKTAFREVAYIKDGKFGESRLITFKPVMAEYVQIYCEKRNGEWGYSIYEINVYKK